MGKKVLLTNKLLWSLSLIVLIGFILGALFHSIVFPRNKEKLFYRLQETKLKITVQCEIMDRILENSLTTLVGKQVKSKQGL